MKAVVFLADGFEECEALIVVDILRRAGIETVTASIMGRLEVDSSRHIRVMADVLAEDVDFGPVDQIVLPGGKLGTENLSKNGIVKEQCRIFAQTKYLAAICAAPSVPAGLGLLEGRKATCHPDFRSKMAGAVYLDKGVVVDGNVITGQGLGVTFAFAFEIVKMLVGEETVRKIKEAICWRE